MAKHEAVTEKSGARGGQFSVPCARGLRKSGTGDPPHAGGPWAGFTLIEVLVVIAIIAILAGLTLSTLGYVNKKGATSRAQAEVATLSAAIESFKLDNGFYPSNAAVLHSNLCQGSKVYFEPIPQMMATNGSVVRFVDPWNENYQYNNYTNYFELWSTAGGETNANNWIRN